MGTILETLSEKAYKEVEKVLPPNALKVLIFGALATALCFFFLINFRPANTDSSALQKWLYWFTCGFGGATLAAVALTASFEKIRLRKELKKISSEKLGKTSFRIEVVFRKDDEAKGKDDWLINSEQATFVAMTFKSLGKAMPALSHFPNLKEASIFAYSLPILSTHHPLLKNKPEDLRNEWIECIVASIAGITRGSPRLQKLNIGILSTEPVFTVSVVTVSTANGLREHKIRYTPVENNQELTDTPTYIYVSDDSRDNYLFNYYKTKLEKLIRKKPRCLFSVPSNFWNSDREIRTFVENLSRICLNPQYNGYNDRHFSVQIKLNASTAGALGFELPGPSESFYPGQVLSIYEKTCSKDCKEKIDAQVDFVNNRATISFGDISGPETLTFDLKEKHFVAFFLLAEYRKEKKALILLRKRSKPGWALDVPGGKAAENDNCPSDVLLREVFEETGLLLDKDKISNSFYVKYDDHSNLDIAPVIAIYYRYSLNEDEYETIQKINLQIVNTGIQRVIEVPAKPQLELYPADRLLKEKTEYRESGKSHLPSEAICHAPISAVKDIAHNVL